jgi:hypothetical protein
MSDDPASGALTFTALIAPLSWPQEAWGPEVADVDEFDIDLRLGELGSGGAHRPHLFPVGAQTDPQACLPTGGPGAGGTCNTQDQTCQGTCAGLNSCPQTHCGATCPNTCVQTCPATCVNTCRETCRQTCLATCGATCNCTNLGTHCNTCGHNCQPP